MKVSRKSLTTIAREDWAFTVSCIQTSVSPGIFQKRQDDLLKRSEANFVDMCVAVCWKQVVFRWEVDIRTSHWDNRVVKLIWSWFYCCGCLLHSHKTVLYKWHSNFLPIDISRSSFQDCCFCLSKTWKLILLPTKISILFLWRVPLGKTRQNSQSQS